MTEVLLLDISLDLPDFVSQSFDKTKVQNGCELLAATVGLCALRALGVVGAGVILRGDSVVSGAWLTKETFKSRYAKRAALLFLVVAAEDDLVINEFVHLPAADNKKCDRSSRRLRPKREEIHPEARLIYPGSHEEFAGPLGALAVACRPSSREDLFSSRGELQLFMDSLSLNLANIPPSPVC